jgi:hypothetical protein
MTGCTLWPTGWKAANALVVDCFTEGRPRFHVHLAANSRSASVISDFKDSGNHLEDLRNARRSAGTYQPIDNHYRINLFLKDGSFGEKPGEQVQLSIDQTTLAFRVDALSPRREGASLKRVIQQGYCKASPYSGLHPEQKLMLTNQFPTKGQAEERSRKLGCEGAHAMGEIWMPCRSGAIYDQVSGSSSHRPQH